MTSRAYSRLLTELYAAQSALDLLVPATTGFDRARPHVASTMPAAWVIQFERARERRDAAEDALRDWCWAHAEDRAADSTSAREVGAAGMAVAARP